MTVAECRLNPLVEKIESGGRRGNGGEIGAGAKALKVDISGSRGEICRSALTATRHLTNL
jgi:hypothetical protein